MTWQDAVNGSYELLGAPFIMLSVIKLYKEKQVHGVSWWAVLFFSTWGLWNLYYYPHLGQWCSFYGGMALAIIQLIWLSQLIYYSRKTKEQINEQN